MIVLIVSTLWIAEIFVLIRNKVIHTFIVWGYKNLTEWFLHYTKFSAVGRISSRILKKL